MILLLMGLKKKKRKCLGIIRAEYNLQKILQHPFKVGDGSRCFMITKEKIHFSIATCYIVM